MSYANRPMGDYKTYGYAGDPGWLSSLWRGFKKVAKVAAPFIPGVGGLVVGAVAGTPGVPAKITPRMPAIPGTFGGAVTFPGGTSLGLGYTGTIVPGRGRLPPFTATGPGVLPGGGRGGTLIPSGYHYVKSGEGYLVRNRRMNVANPRALRKAMRRVQGFEKLARRTISFTRRVKMKKRKS